MADREWGDLRPAPSTSRAHPFLKWAGGKTQIVPELRRFLPPLASGGTYYEPFLGGGAVFFALEPTRAILSDTNAPLVYAYRAVMEELDDLIEALSLLVPPRSRLEYEEHRRTFNQLALARRRLGKSDRIQLAALLIWLNHTCFNGLYRVNSKGEFNVPMGSYKRPRIYSPIELEAVSQTLRSSRAVLKIADFERAVRPAHSGDLVYLDPPYQPLSATASFTGYTKKGFDDEEQRRLARVIHELVDRGVRIVLSNSSTEFIRGLYRDLDRDVVMAPRAINCVGSRRAPVAELVVSA